MVFIQILGFQYLPLFLDSSIELCIAVPLNPVTCTAPDVSDSDIQRFSLESTTPSNYLSAV